MKYSYIAVFVLLSYPAFGQAIDELHKTAAENLAVGEYYEEVTKGDPKASSTDIKEKQGEIEIKKAAAGIGVDTASRKTTVTKTGKTLVEKYIVKNNSGETVVMDNKVKDIPSVPAPKPVTAGAADDLFLQSLGGDSAKAEAYKGAYETEVGVSKEKDFDMSDQIKAAEKEQIQANSAFEAANTPAPAAKSNDGSDLAGEILKSVAGALTGAASGTQGAINPNANASACRSFCNQKGFNSYQYNAHPPAGWAKCGCV